MVDAGCGPSLCDGSRLHRLSRHVGHAASKSSADRAISRGCRMTWMSIANQLILGLSTAAIYVLVSLGLTMIFGMMNVLNFTHGVLYALGAYFSYLLVKLTGNFWVALAAAPAVVAALGILIERISIRPLADRPHLIQFL